MDQIIKSKIEKKPIKTGKTPVSLIGEEARKLQEKANEKQKELEAADPKNKPDLSRQYRDLVIKELIAFELISHNALAWSVDKNFEAFARDFCEQLIKEYDCKTPSEIALTEIIAGAFIRHLNFAQILDSVKDHNNPAYITTIAKEVDRSQRSFINALFSLKQLKSPIVALNVKATTAFVAENQQINTTQNIEKGEINNAK